MYLKKEKTSFSQVQELNKNFLGAHVAPTGLLDMIIVHFLENQPISLPSTAPPACWSAGRLSAEPWAAPAPTGFSPAKTGSSGPGWEAATGSCPSWCPSSCSGWRMAVCVTIKTETISLVFQTSHSASCRLTSLPHCYLHNSTTTESALAGMKPRRKTLRQPQL